MGSLKKTHLFLHSQALLLKIHVITGWNLPGNDSLLTVLQDQFFKKLEETYSNCNVDEIEYAFRNFGTQVKDWGKTMNLNLIDTVMNAYLSERKCISDFEERLKKPEIEYKPTEEELLNMKRELVEMRYQGFLNGIYSFLLMPENGISILALDGFCEADIYEDYLQKAYDSIRNSMLKEIDKYMFSLKVSLAQDVKEKLHSLSVKSDLVIALAKKMALIFCFYKFKEAGSKNIYIKE